MNEGGLQNDINVSVIIVSAGMSERFGEPKAFLNFDQTKSFIQQLISVYYKAGIKTIIIITNNDLLERMKQQMQYAPKELNIKIVINSHPEAGRFSSIKIAVDALNKGHHAFFQNIDIPFVTSFLLKQMLDKIEDGKYVVPAFNNEKGHPVLLSNDIIQHIKAMNSFEGNLRKILNEFPSIEIATDDSNILANINTPEAYMKYFNHAVIH